jgi:hypothetical protein
MIPFQLQSILKGVLLCCVVIISITIINREGDDVVEAENFVFNKIRMIGDGGREFACLQINFLIKKVPSSRFMGDWLPISVGNENKNQSIILKTLDIQNRCDSSVSDA